MPPPSINFDHVAIDKITNPGLFIQPKEAIYGGASEYFLNLGFKRVKFSRLNPY